MEPAVDRAAGEKETPGCVRARVRATEREKDRERSALVKRCLELRLLFLRSAPAEEVGTERGGGGARAPAHATPSAALGRATRRQSPTGTAPRSEQHDAWDRAVKPGALRSYRAG